MKKENIDPDKDEQVDISLSSLGDADNADADINNYQIANNQQNLDPKTAAKTKKIEEDSDEEGKKEEVMDKTAEKMVRNPFKS